MPTRKGFSGFVYLLWIAAALTAIGVAVILVENNPTLPIQTTEPTALQPSRTPTATQPPPNLPAVQTSSILPTVTPTARLQKPQVIGYSVAGRPLEVFQFGQGPVEKMIIAGIHGGYEHNTVLLADEMISYLEAHPEIVPVDETLFILRALNPDGLERSQGFGGRANDHNVDLNRNFPSHWQSDWPRAGCWDYIPIEGGSGPASEPETQALMAFVDTHQLTAFISYHSAALGIFPGGQPPDPASVSLAESLAAVSDYPYPPIDAGCEFTGQLVDWVSDQGIAGVDIELTNHQDSDFEINLAVLSVFLDWTYP
jgi:predicted deacylase